MLSQAPHPGSKRRIAWVDGREAVEGEVIVGYRERMGRIQRERAEFQVQSDTTEEIGRRGARRMRSRGMSTTEMLEALRSNPDVEFVEPNYIIRAFAAPNDASFPSLWALLNTGQIVDGRAGTPGADINVVPAWDSSTGSRANVIAVIDSGIDYTHPDLAANMWTAPRQFSVTVGANTITCAAGTHGYNALTNTCIPTDDNGHGTHVAGIIGAVGNNSMGVTGVNWVTSMMSVKVLGVDGLGTTADAIEAIDWLVKTKNALGPDANVRILNASWGFATASQALDNEIESARNADMLFVAAAGSEGSNNDSIPHYPASSTNANIISVGASDNTGALASYSNFGATSVDLTAPGDSTLSTLPGGQYGRLSGTSMSAPFVSGAAALLLAACPGNSAALKSTLLASVDLHGSMAGKTVSGGSLNVDAAIRRCLANRPTVTASPANVGPGATITVTVSNGPGNATDWLGLYPVGGSNATRIDWKYLNGQQTAPASGITSTTVTFTAPTTGGSYEVRMFSGNSNLLATSSSVTVGVQPTIRINDVSVNEGNSGTVTATFTVTVSPVNASQTVTVNYATANGTATIADNDYVAASGTLSFAPSASTQTFSVTVRGDTAVEPNETFNVNLSNAINATMGDGLGVGTIVTDDAAACTTCPTITAPASVTPGSTVTVQLTNGPANALDWVAFYNANVAEDRGNYQQWQFMNGAQTAPSTGRANATLTFTAPQTPGVYNIRWFANGGYTRLAVSNNITIGAPSPSLSINDVSVNEGNSGSVSATFTVTVSPVNSSQTVTVNYATANGTATAGSDYTAASGTLTFAPSVASQTITVPILGDTAVESNESFSVALSGAANAAIGDAQGAGTIVNDDAPACTTCPTATVQSATVNPGGTITLTLANGPANPLDWVALYDSSTAEDRGNYLQWQFMNGSQTAPSGGRAGATLTFTAPTTPGTYNLRWFSNGGYTRLAISSNITVGNPAPPQPTLSINDVSVSEGNSGAANATFTVTVSPVNPSQTVTVNYATANGTATVTSDYTATSGTLTFSPSVATQTITVPVLGDTTIEGNETFLVNLSGAANATVGDGQGVGTIVSDDAAVCTNCPTIATASTTVNPGAPITVTLTNGPGHTLDWVGLYDSSADDRGNYLQWQYLSGSQNAPASGRTNATLQFSAPSTPGTYNIRWFGSGGYTRLAISSNLTVGTPSPTLSISDVSVNEGNSGTAMATFTVTLSPVNSAQSVTVNYATANGSATTANNDYTATSGTLTFAPSVATQTIAVPIIGDGAIESNETFVVNLSGAANATIGDAQGTGTIVTDDVAASSATVTVHATTVARGGTITLTASNGPGNTLDWLGFYTSGADDRSYQQWQFLSGSQSPPASGRTTATLTFTAPQISGTYEIRFFANGGYTRLATSATITVQ